MDRFRQLQVYVAVVEEEGFAAAGRRLQMSPPAVTRMISALETSLGVKLLDRTTRSVRVTEAGRRYLTDARQILASLESANDAAAGINAEPRGHLSVTAPAIFGRMHVTPGIVKFLDRYPEMNIEAVFLDRMVNLVDEGIDVGVRIGALPDSNLRAIKVGEVSSVVVAAPVYLDSVDDIETPQHLRSHSLTTSSAGNFSTGWKFSHKAGDFPLRVQPRFTTTTNDAAIEATVLGFGITRVLFYQVADLIASKKLRIILREFEPAPLPINIIHREGRYGSVRVRAFIDLLAEQLRNDPAISGLAS
jgi:DNA-binding transcriptional LysR family regulator